MSLEKLLTEALKESVSEAFTTTINLDPELIDDEITVDSQKSILSTLGFTGAIEGSFALCLNSNHACQIISKMLGMEIEEESADVNDGVGEINNIISGGVKNRLSSTEYKFDISIPTSTRGSYLEFKGPEASQRICLRYQCESVQFAVVVIFKIHEDNNDEKKTQDQDPKLSAFDKLNQLMNNPQSP